MGQAERETRAIDDAGGALGFPTATNGDTIIIDGGTGEVFVRPSTDLQRAYAEKVRFYARKQAQYAALRDEPAICRSGERVELNINAGLIVDLPHLHDSGADGVGLYRTELQFMVAQRMPSAMTRFALNAARAARVRPGRVRAER